MCGICGGVHLQDRPPITEEPLRRMATALRHRGPEDSGLYRDAHAGLAHARLSIIDLAGGHQPIPNEDKTVWVTYNGEIFNYPELRAGLEARGHRFSTHTDTEVLVHLYEEKGAGLLADLNGQFAFAIWDVKRKRALLARDRLGILPLHYTLLDGTLWFASEVKAFLELDRFRAELDPQGVSQLFTFWSPQPPRTVFKGVSELPPGHCLVVENGVLRTEAYWTLSFPAGRTPRPDARREAELGEELLALLRDSVRLRLRADVPVAAFLSGGLDSSLISALAQEVTGRNLQTFSVRFQDPAYDEGPHQHEVAKFLGTRHQEITCSYDDVARILPQIVWHAEKPLVRTAPAPLFLLAKLVQESGIKVVQTGEGADEILGGYDLFREMRIRRFWARRPGSRFRPVLLRRLYPAVAEWSRQPLAYLAAFYRSGLQATDLPYYSHLPRWDTTAWTQRFFSAEWKQALADYDPRTEYAASLPGAFGSWEPLAQAQAIEIQTLLSGNLLSSQGDRMVMAHGVESRPAFLDHRVVEWCAALPPSLKLRGLKEKVLLKRIARPLLPPGITQRPKQAYRAPDSASLFSPAAAAYRDELLSPERLARTGCFDPAAIAPLVAKARAGRGVTSARENIALVGILTTQLLDAAFVRRERVP
jgi:asparagine synthase (glutamine-hydrolysing)